MNQCLLNQKRGTLSVLSVFLLCLLFNSAFAQKIGTIKGRVSYNDSLLSGASVSISGVDRGTVTDANGMYTFSVPAGVYAVSASYVGYTTTEVKNVRVTADGIVTANIKMATNGNTQLQEVVVTYGRQRQREITGSVAVVNTANLQDMPVQQFAQQLQGKVAGVQIAQSSGQPGRGVEFRIRGAASFFAGNQPLFVVDGLPITGSINNINPSEIESFSILKDASATALYGSRAANGVVLITTKHAKPGDARIDFNANYGVQAIPSGRLPKAMNAREFATFMNEKYADARKYENSTVATPDVYLNPDQYGTGTNWFDLLTRKAPIQNYDLTLQSAREGSSSTVVVGYQEQQGVMINTNTRLFTLRFNQDLSLLNNKLKVGFNVAPSYRLDHNNRLATDGVGGIFERLFEASPLIAPYDANGNYNRSVASPGMTTYINPLATINLTNDDYKTTRILAGAYLNYEFLKGLSIRTNAGVDKGNETRQYFQSGVVTATAGQTTGTSRSDDNGSWTAEANLVYNKKILTNHSIEALVGYSAQKYSNTFSTLTGLGFPSDDIQYLTQATSISGSSSYTSYALLSSLARLNYNYKGKYLLSAAVRRDGSSRFGGNNQYGNFPSVSVGWNVSDEQFMARVGFIDALKLRASYGITGNNFFGNYDAQATVANYYYDLNNTIMQGSGFNRLANADLRWERNKQLDIGAEIGFLNNRISLTYDYYHKISDGLIQQRQIPRSSGFSQILYNIGEVELWGHEVTISTSNIARRNFTWSSNFNMSFDRNIIKNLVDPGFIRRNTTVSSDYFRQQIGHHLGEFYGFVFQGLYQDARDLAASAKYLATPANPNGSSDVGTIKVKDLNGDGVIDDVNDRTFIGDPTPTFTGGFTNNFTYKNFDLNIHLAFSVGGEILNAAKWAYQTNLDGSRVPLAAAVDRWRSPENPGSGTYPRTKTGTTALGRNVNSQWVENGSYLSAKNISVGYRFKLGNNLLLKSLRIYGSVQQAFVLTKFSGLNPEINFAGLDPTLGIGINEEAYPVPRTYSFGISTTFK